MKTCFVSFFAIFSKTSKSLKDFLSWFFDPLHAPEVLQYKFGTPSITYPLSFSLSHS